MAQKSSTSFELTKVTLPVLEELRLAGWDIKEVANAGILMFSQAEPKQQQFFRSAAYGLDLEHNEKARDLFRKWIVELLADAEAHVAAKTDRKKAKSSKSG